MDEPVKPGAGANGWESRECPRQYCRIAREPW
jgi:hypothetical protein